MGLFSAKYRHFLETTVVRVVDEAQITDAMQETIMQSMLSGYSISTCIKEAVVNGGHVPFERMYRYAEGGKYHYGLPNAVLMSTGESVPVIKETIEYEEGREVALEYGHFRPLNFTHYAWQYLTEELDYNHATNEVVKKSIEVGHSVYLEKIVAHYKLDTDEDVDSGVIAQFEGSSQTGYIPGRTINKDTPEINIDTLNRSADLNNEFSIGPDETDKVVMHFIWLVDEDKPDELSRDSVTIDMAFVSEEDQEYYQAKYSYITVEDGIEKINVKYWTYRPSVTGQHGQLNNLYAPTHRNNEAGTYFPFVLFRREGYNIGERYNLDAPEYTTAKAMLNFIGMDYDEMSAAIEANENVDDIQQAVLQWGIPINTEDQLELNYLARFFRGVYADSGGNVASSRYAQYGSNPFAVPESWALSIGDADYASYISFDSIDISYQIGQVGSIGEFKNTTSLGRYTEIGKKFQDSEIFTLKKERQIICEQVMENVYQEIVITKPVFRFNIAEGQGTEGGATEGKLLVPLDYKIAETFTVWDRRYLYQRSMHFIFNSHVKERVKWYETGLFKAVLIIVAIVVTIYSFGTTSGPVAAAFAAGGVTAAAVVVIQQILIYVVKAYLVDLAFTYLVDELGIEAAMYIAALAIIVSAGQSANAIPEVGRATASNMLMVANNITEAIGESLAEQMATLQAESLAFSEEAEAKMAELEEIGADLLPEMAFDLTAMLTYTPMVVPGEEPDSFFNRTTDSGNIGETALEYVDTYVDSALELPTLADTFGGMHS